LNITPAPEAITIRNSIEDYNDFKSSNALINAANPESPKNITAIPNTANPQAS